jgi:hypothetical protein
MPTKNVPINYSARDFSTIKESLVQHAKRYYPSTFKDFNEAGFGSLMLDTVSYIGDILSFYLDYQANENFLDTANEFKNVEKLARQMGYKELEVPTSHGIVSLFIIVPASYNGIGVNSSMIPILKKGSLFSTAGGNQFILTEDVFFDSGDNETVVARTDKESGLPTHYAIKAYGKVMSGIFEQVVISVGEFQRFLKVELDVNNLAEIIKVEDSEGNEYFQVDYLSQDIIYRPIINRSGKNANYDASSYLRPFVVPRRFTLDKVDSKFYLQFGQGTAASEKTRESVADPSTVALKVYGKNYVSGDSFDPSNLIETDKLGIVPVNTSLIVTVRTNTVGNVNASTSAIKNVNLAKFEFPNNISISPTDRNLIKNSLEVMNEEPIVGDVKSLTTRELKTVANMSYAAQSRAVTREDYKALVHRMPPEFGKIKRVNIVRDVDSFKRNLNVFIISTDENEFLVPCNAIIKQNLKVWLNKNRMINDVVDILDAKIVNFGIEFSVVADLEVNKYDLLMACKNALINEFNRTREIGEPLFHIDITRTLKNIKGVVDIGTVKFVSKHGNLYSQYFYDMDRYLSADGRYIKAPDNVIFELKFPNVDIKGVVL